MKHMSEAEIVRSKKARKAYQALNTPTVQENKVATGMSLVRDNGVTNKDDDSAEK